MSFLMRISFLVYLLVLRTAAFANGRNDNVCFLFFTLYAPFDREHIIQVAV